MWESSMPNQSRALGSKAFDRSDGFGDDDNRQARRSTGRKLELVSRSDFVESDIWEMLPNAAEPALAEAGRSGEPSWSAMFAWIMEGFLLYGASLHPNAVFPIELLPTERDIAQPAAVVPPSDPAASAGVVRRTARRFREFGAGVWAQWRREREIKRAISALKEFDDRTLRDMGIPGRSSIEHVVRYCRDC
jgi:uncharacterized protein YjiS (DUF1127 family)